MWPARSARAASRVSLCGGCVFVWVAIGDARNKSADSPGFKRYCLPELSFDRLIRSGILTELMVCNHDRLADLFAKGCKI